MGNPIARSELCNDIRERLFEAGKHYLDAKFSHATADSLAAWVMDVIPSIAWESEVEWRLHGDGISAPAITPITETQARAYLKDYRRPGVECRRVTPWMVVKDV